MSVPCQKCGHKTSVLEGRDRSDDTYRRRRECLECNHRFTTIEGTVERFGSLRDCAVNLAKINNPFYRQYFFTKEDLKRCQLTWIDRLSVLFRPMYAQVAEGYAIHFKTKADGRIFIFKFEKI